MNTETRRGLPPEVFAERRAQLVRLEFEKDPDLVLINDRHLRFRRRTLPINGQRLFESWVPKYDPDSGDVWITRWDDPTRSKTLPDGGEIRFIPAPKKFGYDALVRPSSVRGEVDLSNIPFSWNVVRLIPQKHEDVESALRQQDEIKHDYGQYGPEYRRLEDVATGISSLTIKYVKNQVTNENLSQLQAEINEILDANGMRRLRDDTLADIADKLLRATGKDSLSRINPGRARYILSSAYVDAARREVVLRNSEEKATRVYLMLTAAREVERANLAEAKGLVDNLIGLDDREARDRIFEYEVPQRIPDEEISRFRWGEVDRVAKALAILRLNPYYSVARIADLLLRGNDFRSARDIRLMQASLERFGLEWLMGFSKEESVDKLIRRRHTFKARLRLKSVSTLIAECLQDERLGDVKVF